MAIPSRFLKPNVKRPTQRPASAISPTVIAVLLSVAAHGVFIAFGPRASFSFAALTEAAQRQDAEDSIVPIMQLTEADRSRLPAFAQPQPIPIPLDSIPLPVGLSGLSGATPKRTSVLNPARQLPTPTTPTTLNQRPRQQLFQRFRTTTPPPPPGIRFGIPPRPTPPPVALVSPPNQSPTDSTGLPDLTGLSTTPSGIQLGDQLPAPPGTRPEASPTPGSSASDLLSQELAAAQSSGNIPVPPGSASGPELGANPEGGESGSRPIAVAEEGTASAQGNALRLAGGFDYGGEDTEPAAVETNIENWLTANAESKSESGPSLEEISIDSNFKVCMDNPPLEGLIGVVVNPDGTQTSTTILKSTGYDILNRLALSTLKYEDFGQPEQPTQYQVAVDVIYEPEGCVEELPETE